MVWSCKAWIFSLHSSSLSKCQNKYKNQNRYWIQNVESHVLLWSESLQYMLTLSLISKLWEGPEVILNESSHQFSLMMIKWKLLTLKKLIKLDRIKSSWFLHRFIGNVRSLITKDTLRSSFESNFYLKLVTLASNTRLLAA